jgi:hypothetical protein
MKITILSLTQINSPGEGGSLFPGFYGSVSGNDLIFQNRVRNQHIICNEKNMILP